MNIINIEKSLHIAIQDKDLDTIKAIIVANQEDLTELLLETAANNKTPLHVVFASGYNHPEIRNYMVDQLARVDPQVLNQLLTAKDDGGNIVLYRALVGDDNSHINLEQILADLNRDPVLLHNIMIIHDQRSQNLFHWIADNEILHPLAKSAAAYIFDMELAKSLALAKDKYQQTPGDYDPHNNLALIDRSAAISTATLIAYLKKNHVAGNNDAPAGPLHNFWVNCAKAMDYKPAEIIKPMVVVLAAADDKPNAEVELPNQAHAHPAQTPVFSINDDSLSGRKGRFDSEAKRAEIKRVFSSENPNYESELTVILANKNPHIGKVSRPQRNLLSEFNSARDEILHQQPSVAQLPASPVIANQPIRPVEQEQQIPAAKPLITNYDLAYIVKVIATDYCKDAAFIWDSTIASYFPQMDSAAIQAKLDQLVGKDNISAGSIINIIANAVQYHFTGDKYHIYDSVMHVDALKSGFDAAGIKLVLPILSALVSSVLISATATSATPYLLGAIGVQTVSTTVNMAFPDSVFAPYLLALSDTIASAVKLGTAFIPGAILATQAVSALELMSLSKAGYDSYIKDPQIKQQYQQHMTDQFKIYAEVFKFIHINLNTTIDKDYAKAIHDGLRENLYKLLLTNLSTLSKLGLADFSNAGQSAEDIVYNSFLTPDRGSDLNQAILISSKLGEAGFKLYAESINSSDAIRCFKDNLPSTMILDKINTVAALKLCQGFVDPDYMKLHHNINRLAFLEQDIVVNTTLPISPNASYNSYYSDIVSDPIIGRMYFGYSEGNHFS